mmetsp:Transcript_23676/g.38949  ORF Transcript_23676/g.38949 Transcript_23676/m.38949 type:complete len:119 (+) Transcript_23676:84-440(+)
MADSTFLVPKDIEKFIPNKVKIQINEVFNKRLKDLSYDASAAPELTKQLCDEIRDRVKTLGFKRHKLVVQVTVGEKQGQGVRVVSRCLWDDKTDNYCSETWQNGNMYVTAMVFGVYYE